MRQCVEIADRAAYILAPDGSLDKMALQGPPDDLAAGKLVFRAVAVEREEFARVSRTMTFTGSPAPDVGRRSRFILIERDKPIPL